jgi:hypothetical protein
VKVHDWKYGGAEILLESTLLVSATHRKNPLSFFVQLEKIQSVHGLIESQDLSDGISFTPMQVEIAVK